MVTLITNEGDRFRHAAVNQFRKGLIWEHEIMPYLEDHFFDQPGPTGRTSRSRS